ncbi:MAG: bifunctional hydroxymethylpyrimidine kinase/phosphomethylpyrimidine kinase [Actinobacteria bacterium]|nr:bifunctional hydroxymethylpyrimidine kinase/phosphomethylpyrimidine kinase [Actinomycetota bacterium]MBU1942963.1 bifunctional hydroxymethylpyrimidine kinase/phosphomethylpyrimidine kinase [Actinomycetota bacterium]MBU2687295.1 bifunctional hydroxymethylpyrimidine kinase/phosphomethylpyrimidine kinase [Actinomycetota bacterium]
MTTSDDPRAERPAVALSIAGLDPSGGAGLVADARTFSAMGVFPMCVAATVTYQNTLGLKGRYDLPPEVVWGQLEALFEDRKPDAVKTGALGSARVVTEVARFLGDHLAGPLVVDPVLFSESGGRLFDEGAAGALRELLLPRAALLTPNVSEAAVLTGIEVWTLAEMEAAAERLLNMGAVAVLVTGGRLEEDGVTVAVDVYSDPDGTEVLRSPWLEGQSVHGTGCVLSAAITAALATGRTMKEAVASGRAFVRRAMQCAVRPGAGSPCANPNP